VFGWVVVDAACKPPDQTAVGEVMEGHIDRFAASQIEKIGWDKNTATPAPANECEDRFLNGLRLFFGFVI
jgi:hypothetical protein